MPKIPINPADIPTESSPLPDNIVYTAVIRELSIADKVDKNGNSYLKAVLEIIEPDDFRGKKLRDNYIGLPSDVEPNMDARQRQRALENGVRFARLLASAGHHKPAPDIDTDSLLGETVKVTIQNEEFPKGSGRLNARVADYLN